MYGQLYSQYDVRKDISRGTKDRVILVLRPLSHGVDYIAISKGTLS